MNPEAHWALIVHIKRSLASYQERHLKALRTRMMGGSDCRRLASCRGQGWGRDGGAGGHHRRFERTARPRERDLSLDEIAELIEVEDAGTAMLQLRQSLPAAFRRRSMPRACALSSGSLKKQMSRKKTEPEAAAAGAGTARTP